MARAAAPPKYAPSLIPSFLNQRPVMVAIAGPNGAGKTTFYRAHVRPAGLRLVNADAVAREMNLGPYEAARIATALRKELVRQRESFAFETVFSDPVGDKLGFITRTAESGYTVVLCFIGISGPKASYDRVAMRVSQGGHDVPLEKLIARFPRTIANLGKALREIKHVLIFDNNDLREPFRLVAKFESTKLVEVRPPTPRWLGPILTQNERR